MAGPVERHWDRSFGHYLPSAVSRLHHARSRGYDIGMLAVQNEWTLEKALALPNDGNQHEVLDSTWCLSSTSFSAAER